MNKKITIKDIYVGRPDAKDEINFDGMGGFVESFVLPDAFNMDNLLNGCPCFITGYKGTGKTALLFYLEHLFEQQDPSSCASFIFFKEEYTEIRKKELESVSKRILSSIVMGDDTMLDNTNFEYIWQWLFFKRIVADNDNFNAVNVVVTKIYPKFALAEINLYGKKLAGNIHISQICDEFVYNIEDKLAIGEEYRAIVIGYDTYHKCWKLTLKLSDSADEYL